VILPWQDLQISKGYKLSHALFPEMEPLCSDLDWLASAKKEKPRLFRRGFPVSKVT
jgi:hypothetical protein